MEKMNWTTIALRWSGIAKTVNTDTSHNLKKPTQMAQCTNTHAHLCVGNLQTLTTQVKPCLPPWATCMNTKELAIVGSTCDYSVT